jgi:thioester reductase-like protein
VTDLTTARPQSLGGDDRGQLVLAAAGVVAVALLAMTAAYLQLGAHPDVTAERDVGPREATDSAVGVLSRAVDQARVAHAGRAWSERDAVVDAVHDDLGTALESLETSRIAKGTAYSVAYDQAAASEYATEHCPRGDGRAFGDCEAIAGVVVQERAGETTVLAVAFEVTVTTPDGETTVVVVL